MESSPWPENAVCHIKQPNWPQFRFEWHPQTKRVYYIRADSPHIGRALAWDIIDQGSAVNAVLIFLRGYQEGRDGREYEVTAGAA